jgi:hypothetical protein
MGEILEDKPPPVNGDPRKCNQPEQYQYDTGLLVGLLRWKRPMGTRFISRMCVSGTGQRDKQIMAYSNTE